MTRLRIGTRGSDLALWQARHLAALIDALPGDIEAEIVVIQTQGDQNTDQPLWAIGSRSFFTKAIDDQLLGGHVDLAVHSLKDLETRLEPGLALGAVLEREDPRDMLVSRDGVALDELPKGARVGTSSLRRRAFLLHARPDLHIGNLRGNVPTRLEQIDKGSYDAVMLAAAGLNRLELVSDRCVALDTDIVPPAVGQGAIGVVCREDQPLALDCLHQLDHAPTRVAVTAERFLLRRLEGGCHAPIGALAQLEAGILTLTARVCSPDGQILVSANGSRPAGEIEAIGHQVAEDLLNKGAKDIIDGARALAGKTS